MPTTFDVFHPFDAGAGAHIFEDQWRQMARLWAPTHIPIGEDDEMEAFGDSTGMQVKVRTGQAWVEGHYGANTSQKTLLIAAADGSNPRIDRVVLRADFVNNRLELDVLTGVPDPAPSAPTLTQSTAVWEISLARVAVGAGVSTITAGNVTDERRLAVHDVAHSRAQRVEFTGIRTTTSSSFAAIPTDNVQIDGFVKFHDDTIIVADIAMAMFATFGVANTELAARINGVDHVVVKYQCNAVNSVIDTPAGSEEISGVPAGIYTVQLRWRRAGGTGTLNSDPACQAHLSVTETY